MPGGVFTPTRLEDLVAGVAITTPAAGQVLTYEDVSGLWKNRVLTAAQVSNAVDQTATYANPSWITSLAGSKVVGNILGNAASITGAVTQSQVTGLGSALSLLAPLASPSLTGTPTAPTASSGTNTTQVATTAFVQAGLAGIVVPVTSVFGRTGAVTAASGDYTAAQVTNAASMIAANTFTLGPNVFQSGGVGNVGLVVKGAASQSANLTEWQDSTGSVLASLGYVTGVPNFWVSGVIVAGTSTTSRRMEIGVGGIAMSTITSLRWSPGSTYPSSGDLSNYTDVAIIRNGVGILEVNTGSLGNFGGLRCGSPALGTVGLVVKGVASQSGDLQQWQDVNSSVLSKIAADGSLTAYGQAVHSFLPLAVPTGVTAGTPASGGAFAAGTYFWVVTATNAAGETIKSAEVTATVTLNQKVTISWSQVNGATGYKVYRSTTTGTYGASSLLTTVASGATLSYADTGTATTTGTPPTATTGGKAVVQAWSGQTGNLQEWQNGSGSSVVSVLPSGTITACLHHLKDTPATSDSVVSQAFRPDLNLIGLMSDHRIQWTNATSGNFFSTTVDTGIGRNTAGVLEVNNGTLGSLAALRLGTQSASVQPLIVQGAASQSANLQEWQDSNSSVLRKIGSDGSLTTYGQAVNSFLPLAVPTGVTAGTPASGGAFAAGTYFWVVTATNGAGETVQSSQVTATVTLNQKVTISWSQVNGATGYKVYRSTTTGTYGASSLLATIASGATLSYADTGTATTTGTPPTATTGGKVVVQGWGKQTANTLEVQHSNGQVGFAVSCNHDGQSASRVGIDVKDSTGVGVFGANNDFGVATAFFGSSAINISGSGSNIGKINTTSGGGYCWTSSATNGNTTADTGLARSAAGVAKVTNGSTGLGGLVCGAPTASTVGLTVQGAPSQSANLQEWQNSSGTALASINAAGGLKANVFYGDITADADAATVTFDMAVTNQHTVTLGGNRTLAVTNDQVGQAFHVALVQDGTGSRTATWWSGIKWPGGQVPTLTTTAGKADTFTFRKIAAGSYYGYPTGFNF